METFNDKIEISTNKGIDIVNITDEVKGKLENLDMETGTCTVFNPGSTGSIILNEDEPMLRQDIKDKLSELVTEENVYKHPSNGHSHLRALLLGPQETIPILDGKLDLGTWQDIMFVEMDTKPRSREISVVFTGESP